MPDQWGGFMFETVLGARVSDVSPWVLGRDSLARRCHVGYGGGDGRMEDSPYRAGRPRLASMTCARRRQEFVMMMIKPFVKARGPVNFLKVFW